MMRLIIIRNPAMWNSTSLLSSGSEVLLQRNIQPLIFVSSGSSMFWRRTLLPHVLIKASCSEPCLQPLTEAFCENLPRSSDQTLPWECPEFAERYGDNLVREDQKRNLYVLKSHVLMEDYILNHVCNFWLRLCRGWRATFWLKAMFWTKFATSDCTCMEAGSEVLRYHILLTLRKFSKCLENLIFFQSNFWLLIFDELI